MSTNTLNGLLEYLHSTLSPANMLWLGTQLVNFAKEEDKNYKKLLCPESKEELNAMLDAAEARIASGRYISNDEVMQWIDKELTEEEPSDLPLAV